MQTAITRRLALEHERLTIARGYGVVTRVRDHHPVVTITDITPPEAVTIRLRDGQLQATMTSATVDPWG